MLYELGKVLKFNNAEWGFIDYKKGVLSVFSFEDKKKVNFKLDSSTFKRIYSNALDKVSQETINFALNEEKERDNLLKQLKPGVKFIGSDDKEYTFLRLRGKKVEFYEGNDTFTAKIEFIKSLTGEFDNDYINHLSVVNTKKDYKALTNEEKVKIAINYFKSCYNQEGTEYEILEIGNIVSGEAFYHEVDEYYNLIGLQIKFKYRFDFKGDFNTETGFFPIYIGKIPNYYPVSFEESYGSSDFKEHSYTNGCGDEIEVHEILVNKSALDKISI